MEIEKLHPRLNLTTIYLQFVNKTLTNNTKTSLDTLFLYCFLLSSVLYDFCQYPLYRRERGRETKLPYMQQVRPNCLTCNKSLAFHATCQLRLIMHFETCQSITMGGPHRIDWACYYVLKVKFAANHFVAYLYWMHDIIEKLHPRLVVSSPSHD